MDRDTVVEIKRHFGMVAEDLRSDVRLVAEGVETLRDEMHREVGSVREDLGQEMRSVGEDLGARIQAVANDGRVLREEFAGLRGEFAGLRGEFAGLRGEFSELRGSVAQEFEETRALVRLSYGQLDRRVRTLETEMADLRERLERVEGHIAG